MEQDNCRGPCKKLRVAGSSTTSRIDAETGVPVEIFGMEEDPQPGISTSLNNEAGYSQVVTHSVGLHQSPSSSLSASGQTTDDEQSWQYQGAETTRTSRNNNMKATQHVHHSDYPDTCLNRIVELGAQANTITKSKPSLSADNDCMEVECRLTSNHVTDCTPPAFSCVNNVTSMADTTKCMTTAVNSAANKLHRDHSGRLKLSYSGDDTSGDVQTKKAAQSAKLGACNTNSSWTSSFQIKTSSLLNMHDRGEGNRSVPFSITDFSNKGMDNLRNVQQDNDTNSNCDNELDSSQNIQCSAVTRRGTATTEQASSSRQPAYVNQCSSQSQYLDMLSLPVTIGEQKFEIKQKYPRQKTLQNIDYTACPNPTSTSEFFETESFTGRHPGDCFNIDVKSNTENTINYLPEAILVQIFQNLSVFGLLRQVSCVCKYWYNLARDPDLWCTLNLVNQHRMRDEDLIRMIKFSQGRLRSIDLTDCRFISNSGIQQLVSSCLNLQVLILMRLFEIGDEAFEHLVSVGLCRKLEVLCLDVSHVTDKAIIQIARSCAQLRCLQLNQCTGVSDLGMDEVALNCPRLTQLHLDHCTRVTDACILKIVAGCPDLYYLNLTSCHGISNISLMHVSKLTHLKTVELSNMPRLMPDCVVHLSRFCKDLQCVNLSLNPVINDECIEQVAKNLPRLKKLYCVSCNISDTSLESLAKYSSTLEALDVGWCQEISDIGIRVISQDCAKLDYLGLIRCDKITIETIEELSKKYPRIKYSTFGLESRRLIERARQEGYRFEMTAP